MGMYNHIYNYVFLFNYVFFFELYLFPCWAIPATGENAQ
jgi:hypothetical protein